ncbi:MAG: UDP-N-acetylmuramoyl-L-alanine--D-glutamate ligase [candidate division WOR-3 bacterium]
MRELEKERFFLVLGLGRATTPIVQFLLWQEKKVFAHDEVSEKGKPFLANKHFTFVPLEEIPKLPEPLITVISPGISEDSQLVLFAKKKGEVISDIEFVYQILRKRAGIKIVAITGTNGKSTTTALLGNILQKAKKRVFVGGNIAPGKPAGAALFTKKDIFIFEVSSFQLEKIKDFRPHGAVLLNIGEDHLDRYGNLEKYIAAKANIFLNQKEDDFAVLNYDDCRVRTIAKKIKAKIFWFSLRKKIQGIFWQNGIGYIKLPGEEEKEILRTTDVALKGKFNLANTLAVSLVAYLFGLGKKEIIKGIRSFPGLPHRLEFVRKVGSVQFINNSMATNPAAFAASLSVFPKPVILIAGGKNKGFSLTDYERPMKEFAKYIILIGEVQQALFNTLSPSLRQKTYLASSLKEAVKKALKIAQKNDIVLFSPGFASFDMFKDFVDRGNSFKRIVRSL